MVETIEKKYTVEEYFELEKTSEVRHEFYYGKLIPMSGESKNANRLARFFIELFSLLLRPKGIEILTHDIKTRVKEEKIYRYPDVVFAPISDDDDSHMVKKPIVIVEVLSDSTASTDRDDKLKEYLNIPSLKHYLIVAQDQKTVEMYTRQENGKDWTYSIFTEDSDVVKISALEISFSMNELYGQVRFKKS